MLELGDAHEDGHRAVGDAAGRTPTLLVVVGSAVGAIADGAPRTRGSHPTRILVVPDAAAALEVLRPRLRDGDVVLVKGSRGIGLDALVDGAPGRAGSGAMTVELIQGLLLAFALVVILMSPYIRLLRAIGFGKRIREEGPESHYVKEGTPTMGGLLIVAVVLAIYFFLAAAGRVDVRAARGAGRRRAARRLRRLPQRPDGGGDPRPPEADLADRRRVRRRLPDPADLRHHGHRGAVRRRGR